MGLIVRTAQKEDDYWRIREFLRQVFLLNDRKELSWQAYRFDYCRWHGFENVGSYRLEEHVFLWETEGGQIAAVLNPEGRGQAFLQVHPDHRTSELVDEMLSAAEEHLACPHPDDRRKLWVWAHEHDELRRGILARRGYTRGDEPEYQRRRALSGDSARPLTEVLVPEGYTVRALGDSEELPKRSYVSWKAFHPNEPDDQYDGWQWYRNIQRAPLYRRDLDIVAVAPAGEFASFCTVWFDDVTRTGAFEPVGTAPAHQRQGLGKAVMGEGLRRLKRMGATMAYVGSYAPAAHALYASLGFTEYDLSEPWGKEL
jgi:mycothiol synthase